MYKFFVVGIRCFYENLWQSINKWFCRFSGIFRLLHSTVALNGNVHVCRQKCDFAWRTFHSRLARACLGFTPRSESFTFCDVVTVGSICCLDQLALNVSSVERHNCILLLCRSNLRTLLVGRSLSELTSCRPYVNPLCSLASEWQSGCVIQSVL